MPELPLPLLRALQRRGYVDYLRPASGRDNGTDEPEEESLRWTQPFTERYVLAYADRILAREACIAGVIARDPLG
jgi:hypothetical protein